MIGFVSQIDIFFFLIIYLFRSFSFSRLFTISTDKTS